MTQSKPRRLNRAMGRHANFAFLSSDHLRPLVISLIFGLFVGQVFHLGPIKTIVLIAAPFATWIIVVGDKPRKFLSTFESIPVWTRGRVIHNDPLHKKKIGRIRK